jgi:NitT/TauT family transport system substrate-binding protein
MMNLAAQGAPVISVAVIDAQGTEAVLVRPDAEVKDIKDLEGKQIMTTAGAGVNTFFPVVVENAGLDMGKIELVNVAEGALVSSYLQNLAPAILGGIDDKPAEIVANGGEEPVIFAYSDYGVHQPGYSIVAHQDMVAENPDLVGRFVRATLKATQAAKDDPDAAIQALINWSGSVEDQKEQTGACSTSHFRYWNRRTRAAPRSAATSSRTGRARSTS